MFNIPPCTSDIFFCMKSDICPVNILQLPLCTKKNYTLTKKMKPGRRFTTGLLPHRGGRRWRRATVTPTGRRGKDCRMTWGAVVGREREQQRERNIQEEDRRRGRGASLRKQRGEEQNETLRGKEGHSERNKVRRKCDNLPPPLIWIRTLHFHLFCWWTLRNICLYSRLVLTFAEKHKNPPTWNPFIFSTTDNNRN